MKQKLYVKLAGTIDAYHRCIETGNSYADIHEDTILRLTKKNMPSGGGIDSGMTFNFDKSSANKLVFDFGYHHMGENGFYDGWTSHSLVVTASLPFGMNMRVTGSNRNDIKEYFYQIFDYALNEEVE